MVPVSNSGPGEVETGGSRVHDHQLHREFETYLGFVTPCLKKERKGQGLLKISTVSGSAWDIYVVVALFCEMKGNKVGESHDWDCLVLTGSPHPTIALKDMWWLPVIMKAVSLFFFFWCRKGFL